LEILSKHNELEKFQRGAKVSNQKRKHHESDHSPEVGESNENTETFVSVGNIKEDVTGSNV